MSRTFKDEYASRFEIQLVKSNQTVEIQMQVFEMLVVEFCLSTVWIAERVQDVRVPRT
jgi:hypothetical protein